MGWGKARPSAARTSGQLAATVAVAVGLGYLVALVPRELPSGNVELGALALVLLYAAVVAFSLRWLTRGDWFHPAAFPLLYVATCASLPIAYVIAFSEPLANPTIQSFDITPRLIAVFALTVVALAAGIAAGIRLPRLPRLTRERRVEFRHVLYAGRAVLLVALGSRLFTVITTYGLPYGTGSVTFGLTGALQAIAGVALLAGTVVVVLANVRLRRRTLAFPDLALLGSFAFATLLAGSRGELLAPALFVLFAHHTYVRKVGFAPLATAAIVLLVVFQGVSGARAGQGFLADPRLGVERTLGSIATPIQVQSLVMQRVPSRQGYLGGSTYVASAVRQVPGPIANAALGPPDDTASFELRRILEQTNPNFGYGFSLPSEGYLNFGLLGVPLVMVLVGGLLGWAYRQQVPRPSRPVHLLYPILVATLPIAFRSDAVEQMKLVLYPMLLLTAVLYLSSWRGQPSPGG